MGWDGMGWDDDTGDDAAENNLHLLTPPFFRSLHRILTPGGRVVLFSDNRRYLEQLCVAASGLRAEEEETDGECSREPSRKCTPPTLFQRPSCV